MSERQSFGADTEVASRTRGHVLEGVRAKYYDIGNSLFGVPLVTRSHVDRIEIRPGECLLDIGCGTGEVLTQLHRRLGDRVTLCGIDPSVDILEVARQKLHNATSAWVECGSGESLEFDEESFDWVVSSLTFHHLPMDVKRATLAEAFRVLKPGGKLLITDFGKPTGVVGRLFGKLWSWHAYTDENLRVGMRDLILAEGFCDLSVSVQAGIMHHTLAYK